MNLADVRRRRWVGIAGRSSGRAAKPRADGAGRTRVPSPVVDDSALQTERARFAAGIDRELRLACHSEVAMRRELGCAARVLIDRRLYRRIGFVRLGDYARERLGISGRALQDAAEVAKRLDALPAISRAYDRSELSWARARVLCSIASVEDEEQWLEVARSRTVEQLEQLAKRSRPRSDIAPDRAADGDEIDGEPALRWRFACPARVRAVWRRAVELASRTAGGPLGPWEAAELIAAEGFSGRPSGASVGDRSSIEAMRLARRQQCAGEKHEPPVTFAAPEDGALRPADGVGERPDTMDGVPVPAEVAQAGAATSPTEPTPGDAGPSSLDSAPVPFLVEPAPADAFALDARLHEAMRVIRTAEPRMSRLLRVVVDHKLYRMLGYPRLGDYARERLGLSIRKVWALAKLERATARSDDFAHAYREGRLSWVQAVTLLPVLDRANAAAWVVRADGVTVRRLADEVSWVLEARDVSGSAASLAPPPLDSALASPAAPLLARCDASSRRSASGSECRESTPACGVQIGARFAESMTGRHAAYSSASPLLSAELDAARSEIVDAEIAFTAPASVIALLRDVLDAFAEPGAPRWRALERLLHHVVHHWESQPRHPDPIFARDGWRCTVPGCSSRRNLHDHHITFRSRGGLNTRDNRTAVCAAHHLHGLHDGTIRAAGPAPSGIEWQLGVRSGGPPFATYVGDRRCRPAADDYDSCSPRSLRWSATTNSAANRKIVADM